MKTTTLRILLLLLCLCRVETVPGLNAQGPSATPVLIRAGRLFDSVRGTMLPARDILVRGNIIAEVAPAITAPAGALVIDLRAYTVLPGLIDAHSHLLLEVEPYASITTDVVAEGEVARALRGAGHARTYLDAGFTTVRDLGNAGLFADIALKRAIADGSLPGPRLYVSGPGLSAAGGQIEGPAAELAAAAAIEYRIIQNVDDARTAVREHVARGADLIKVYADQRPKPVVLSVAELRAIVDEAHRLGVRVTAHATGDASAARAIEAGVDSIEHGYELSATTLARLRERGIAVVPTFTDLDTMVIGARARARAPQPLTKPPAEQVASALADYRQRLRRLFDSGVRVAAGSDMYWNVGLPRGVAAKRVLFAYEQTGIEPVRILQAATISAAVVIGEPRLGVIEPGAWADLIAVDGNPLEALAAIERVTFVMKSGKVHLPGPKP
ncbi:MAG TPA: amidohydrolase family protein [Vicinamibacterales bacterium]|nr:amidohydrolase family protein [Vicinamibacterales bacterium]